MRTFGTDSPDLFTFRIEGIDETLAIPLAGSLPIRMSARFADIASMADDDAKQTAALHLEMDLLERYLPDGALDMLTAQDVGQIFAAWSEASGSGDVSAGE